MSVVYSNTVKNNRLQQVINAVDGGSGVGVLVIGTSALSGATGVLVSISLVKPSFGAPSSGVITLAGTPLSATAGANGTAAKAEIRDSTGATIVSGLTVGTSGTDIIIGSTNVSSGLVVNVTSGTITHG